MPSPDRPDVREQRVRIIHDVESLVVADPSARLPWRESWAPYFTDREGLLEALAVRRRCLRMLAAGDLPADADHNAAWRIRRAEAALARVLRRHGWAEDPALPVSA